jgi:class 3 adenylate cyclase
MQPAAYLVDVSKTSPDRRKLTVVMHADVVGYSRLVGLDDAGTAARLRRMRREIIEPMIVQNGGIVRQTAGDSLLVLFDSIDGALQTAIAVQRAITIEGLMHLRSRFSSVVASVWPEAGHETALVFRIGHGVGPLRRLKPVNLTYHNTGSAVHGVAIAEQL